MSSRRAPSTLGISSFTLAARAKVSVGGVQDQRQPHERQRLAIAARRHQRQGEHRHRRTEGSVKVHQPGEQEPQFRALQGPRIRTAC